ncbi:ParB/RepB/Spo0J family partition protein [Gottfriedia acidiceleris]|uniref:ParB/RepB/Spo0J family partition protein n=1 Tax=Gottfriedia acidiceleris TaxID=371036 RepID=UPI0030005552
MSITNLKNEPGVSKTDGTRKLTIKGETKNYIVYRIPLDKPFYNDRNGRIATYISKYKSEGNLIDRDVVSEYNNILHKFIRESNSNALDQTKENIKRFGQRLPGVVLQDGRVIDGNRRFTCLRELKKEGENVFFEAVILDTENGIDARDIKLLELNLQHGEERPVDYNAIDYLVDMYYDIVKNKMFSVEEYVKSTNKKRRDVELGVKKAELMVQFLEFINAKEQYFIARDMDLDGPLQECVTILNKDFKKWDFEELIKPNFDDKDAQLEFMRIRNVLFTAIYTSRSQSGGDLTRFIRDMGKSAIHSNNREEFLENYEEIVEEVFETLQEEEIVTSKSLKDVGKKLEEVRKEGTKIIEKVIEDNQILEARKKPVELLGSALNYLSKIDNDQVKRLNGEDAEEFELILNEIRETLTKYGEALEI